MVALAIGPDERRIAAYFHPGDGTATRTCGVVLCNPVGWEALACHQSYRVLAERLAAVGFPVLRFDYDGTGDSAGSDADPGRLRAWVDSTLAAVTELRLLARVREVSLVGVHLGGTLATLAAAELGGVASLIAWATFPRGKSFVRQARAYRMLNIQDEPAPGATDDLEAAGFLFTSQTLRDLSAVDLLRLTASPAPRVLLLAREPHATEDAWMKHLQSNGCDVTSLEPPGYLAMMREPRKSEVPEEAFGQVTAWLVKAHPQTQAATSPSPLEPARIQGEGYQEEMRAFGERGRIFGILTAPRKGVIRRETGVILLNTASDHRVGPNRAYVLLVRALARRGYLSLRFDPTGIGDSRGPESGVETHAYSAARLAEVPEAMNFLAATQGLHRFVLVGLCSGAHAAFHTGMSDPRVVGEVLVNPQTFTWKAGDSLELKTRQSFKSSRYYRRAVFEPSNWSRAVRGQVNVRGVIKVTADRVKRRLMARLSPFLQGRPGLLDVHQAVRAKLARGVELFFLLSGDDEGTDFLEAHLGKYGRRMRRYGNFRFEIIDGPDHTFSQQSAQRLFIDLVVEHISRRLG